MNTYFSICRPVSNDNDVDNALAPSDPNSLIDNLRRKRRKSNHPLLACIPSFTQVLLPCLVNTYSSCCKPVSDDRHVDNELAPAEPIIFAESLRRVKRALTYPTPPTAVNLILLHTIFHTRHTPTLNQHLLQLSQTSQRRHRC